MFFWVSRLLYLQGPDQLLLTFISLPIKGEINQDSPHNLLRDAGYTHRSSRRKVCGRRCALKPAAPLYACKVLCTCRVTWVIYALRMSGGEELLRVCVSACLCVCFSDSTAERGSESVWRGAISGVSFFSPCCCKETRSASGKRELAASNHLPATHTHTPSYTHSHVHEQAHTHTHKYTAPHSAEQHAPWQRNSRN